MGKKRSTCKTRHRTCKTRPRTCKTRHSTCKTRGMIFLLREAEETPQYEAWYPVAGIFGCIWGRITTSQVKSNQSQLEIKKSAKFSAFGFWLSALGFRLKALGFKL